MTLIFDVSRHLGVTHPYSGVFTASLFFIIILQEFAINQASLLNMNLLPALLWLTKQDVTVTGAWFMMRSQQ